MRLSISSITLIRYFSFLILLEAISFPQTVHPFTVEFTRYELIITHPQTIGPRLTTIQAMRSDGASVRRFFFQKGNPLWGTESVQITNQTDGSVTTIVDPLNKVKRTYTPPYWPGEKGPVRVPMHRRNVFDPTCRTHKPHYFEQDGKQVTKEWTMVSDKEEILGLHVIEWSVEEPGVQLVEYQSPDCNCLSLLTRSISKDEETGEVVGIIDETATKVRLGEPDDELFSLPPDLKEVPPGEFLQYIEARQVDNIPETP